MSAPAFGGANIQGEFMTMSARRRSVALGLFVSVALGACGGGGGGGDGEIDLYAAYDRVSGGMSSAAVVEAVGMQHNGGQNALPTETVYRWETGTGTARYTALSVTVDVNRGAIQKVVNGPRGLRSLIF